MRPLSSWYQGCSLANEMRCSSAQRCTMHAQHGAYAIDENWRRAGCCGFPMSRANMLTTPEVVTCYDFEKVGCDALHTAQMLDIFGL
jgi:hypothetical protein